MLSSAKKTLLVVHGHGTWKLRAAIRRYLEDHPLVERFEEPPIYEGGSGATQFIFLIKIRGKIK